MQDILQPTISVLTAMITPAVMISACGTLILSTSQRLSRVIGRVFEWTRWLDAAGRAPSEEAFARENAAAFFMQFETTSRRARLLHWGLSAFYFALGTFVADMLVIGGDFAAGYGPQLAGSWVRVDWRDPLAPGLRGPGRRVPPRPDDDRPRDAATARDGGTQRAAGSDLSP